MAELRSTNDIVADAYIKEEARVLDPTLLDKSLVDRMPQPTGCMEKPPGVKKNNGF